MTRTVAVVPHTHWDREWYAPFQTFRLRLVDLLDEFLPRLEADPSYARFLLDGQMAVVDDYLAIRPEAEAVLHRLAGSGRLGMGPWYILMDEFLVSGETIVRNLQRGLARAAQFGGAMEVGYLPDMFGHVAQMPQILRLAGIDHAVVWRGVPSPVDRTAFWWSAPDGSRVRAEYLPGGYGVGASIPDDAKLLVRRIGELEDELGELLAPGAPILFMNGTDHEVPQPWLGRVIAEANDVQDDYHFVISSLPEYLAEAPIDGLPAWTGELRSGARANLLMGVGSNRVDVKQAAARAERGLERLAEPLCALFLPPDRWPEALLDVAWREVIRNSAHDSICACSHDEVVAAVIHRYAEARQIADGLAQRAVAALARSLPVEGTAIVNPSARARGGLIELTLPGDGAVGAGAQLLHERGPGLGHVTVRAADLPGILGPIRSQQLDEGSFVNEIEITEDDDGVHVVLHADARLRTVMNIAEAKADLMARLAGRPDVQVHLRIKQPVSRRILTRVDGVPGYGWTTWQAVASPAAPVVVFGTTMANDLISVTAADDGTFSIDGLSGLGRLVDDGDAGDTYNYSPASPDKVVDRPDRVDIDVLESGPMRARLRLRATYTWPERLDRLARVGAVPTVVTTVLELRADERFVRVRTSFDNNSRDHRLRAWFPLPSPVTVSRAECAFSVVERGLEAEGGPSEYGLPTFPSRRFVSAGPVTIAHEGLLEYELVDDGSALALTLLRATGYLSRVEMAYRPLPAGPPLPLEGPQMQGPIDVRYAVQVGEDVDAYALVEDAFVPLLTAHARGGGSGDAAGTALEVSGAQVSALRRVPGGLELRVFNPSSEPTLVSVGARTGWLVDLRGRPLAPFDGCFDLGPHAIATAILTA